MLRFITILALAFLATPARAQGGASGWEEWSFFIPLVLIFGIFYFLIIRPQKKRVDAHRTMVAALRRGDEVITAGGLVGRIHRVMDDGECVVELADGLRVRVIASTIAERRSGEGKKAS